MDHKRAFELLPWLVNGSLAAQERDAVEEHARDCLLCRRELKEQQCLRTSVLNQPTVHISVQRDFDKLLQQIDDRPIVASGAARIGGRAWWTPARIAAAGATCAVVFAAMLWIALPANDGVAPSAYRTLAAPAIGSSREIDVVFVDSITSAQIRQVLSEIGGEITAGPSDVGRYTVRLDDRKLTADDVSAIAERLAADPRVRFAAPAVREAPSP
jgi:hypothetical protein